MFVEQLARMFPPVVVRREAERPMETHTIIISIRRQFLTNERNSRAVQPSLGAEAWSEVAV